MIGYAIESELIFPTRYIMYTLHEQRIKFICMQRAEGNLESLARMMHAKALAGFLKRIAPSC